MNKITKRIMTVFMIMAVVFTLTACRAGYEQENQFGGKTYSNSPPNTNTRHYGERRISNRLHEKFPSDKIPVLGGGVVGMYDVIYDKNDKLISARLSMDTRMNHKEAAEEYRKFYSDYAEFIADKTRVNEYDENLTTYKYAAYKDNFVYEVVVDPLVGFKYSKIKVTVREKHQYSEINSVKDLENY